MKKSSLFLLVLISTSLQAKPCKDLVQRMLELYPDQNTEMMMTRIQNAKNKHMFMRAFIPRYYQEAFEVKDTIPAYNKLKKHTGHIVGDAHVGNFGFLMDNKGKPTLTLVDFDDVAEAPLFLDVMRLSQSASYTGDFNQVKLLEAYKRGLNAADHQLSKYLGKLNGKSQKGGIATKADYTSTAQGPRFSAKQEPTFAVTAQEQKSIEKVLKDKFGKETKLHDSYRTMKESGGSAYGTRFHTLVEFDGDMHLIEFKEIMEGGVVSGWVKKPVSDNQRIKSAMNTYLGSGFEQSLDVVEVGNKPFQLRFKAEGNKAIDLSAVSEKEISKVVEDEFYVLGQLHRRSLGGTNQGVSSYAQDLDTVSPEEWEQSVKVMKKIVKKDYEAGNK